MGKYDWEEIQKFYDNNGTYRTIRDEYNINMNTISRAVKKGYLKTRTKSEAVKLRYKNNPESFKISEEHKKKISEGRKKYLLENPDQVPYLLNHYSKGESYPEKYFKKIFDKSGIKYERYYRTGLYHIDISIFDKSIAIEIDGEQHYVDPRIVESDIRKDKYLKEEGWDIIRIRWSKYQKLNKEEKEKYIENLFSYINGSNTKPMIKNKENYCSCGVKIYKTSKNCKICANFKKQTIKRPPYNQLLKEIEETNYSIVAGKYGVSDNTIRKWKREYEKIL